MTDQLDGSDGGNANAAGQASDGSGVNSQSETAKLLARIEALESHQKTQQSGKDRGINQLREETTTQFAEISQYLKDNADPAVAERNYLVDQMLKKQNADQQSPGAGVGSGTDVLAGQNVQGDESANLLKGLGVDNQSAEFKQLIAQGQSPEQAALNILAAKQLAANASDNDGNASGISGGSSGQGVTGAAQEALVQARIKELDGQQHWTPFQLQALNDKYRKLGLNVE